MLAFGIWTGPRAYEIRFEPFADRLTLDRRNREESLRASAARYAAALEDVARAHPYNWFNFYDFWEEMPDTPPKPAAAAPRRALLALPLLATPARGFKLPRAKRGRSSS